MIKFEDFQLVTITLHQYINMLDGKFNIHWDIGKKQQIRLSKWITCETDSDEEQLEERFIPNKEELIEHHLKNLEV